MIFRFIGSSVKNWAESAKEGVWELAKAFLSILQKRLMNSAGSELAPCAV